MKKELTAGITQIILATTAGVMACIGRSGWGWFLVACLLVWVGALVTIGGKVDLAALNQSLQWLCLVECSQCGAQVRMSKAVARFEGMRGVVITCKRCDMAHHSAQEAQEECGNS